MKHFWSAKKDGGKYPKRPVQKCHTNCKCIYNGTVQQSASNTGFGFVIPAQEEVNLDSQYRTNGKNAEVQKLNYGNRSTETEVRK